MRANRARRALPARLQGQEVLVDLERLGQGGGPEALAPPHGEGHRRFNGVVIAVLLELAREAQADDRDIWFER